MKENQFHGNYTPEPNDEKKKAMVYAAVVMCIIWTAVVVMIFINIFKNL
jgi:hypothetical protein